MRFQALAPMREIGVVLETGLNQFQFPRKLARGAALAFMAPSSGQHIAGLRDAAFHYAPIDDNRAYGGV
jgi:hypothetical protein